MDFNNILTQTGLDTVLYITGDGEPSRRCSNLNCGSHFQMPNGHLHVGSLPEPPMQSFALRFPWWSSGWGSALQCGTHCNAEFAMLIQSLIWEDPTGRRAAKPVCQNYWACALEPTSHPTEAHTLQSLCSAPREAHAPLTTEWPPFVSTWENPLIVGPELLTPGAWNWSDNKISI